MDLDICASCGLRRKDHDNVRHPFVMSGQALPYGDRCYTCEHWDRSADTMEVTAPVSVYWRTCTRWRVGTGGHLQPVEHPDSGTMGDRDLQTPLAFGCPEHRKRR